MLFFMLLYQLILLLFGGIMLKYSRKIINDYINGEEIDNIEELENDMDFMISVIDTCNDKNMYYMCGDNLKNDLNFIKFLINKFQNDIEFILMISKECMKHCDEIDQVELKILLCDCLKDDSCDEVIAFKLSLGMFYMEQRLIFESCMEKLLEFYHKRVNSLGFDIILDEYNHSELIKEYFAKNMLNEVFDFNNLEFEKLLHQRFKSKKELNDMGINNFLIQYVYTYDEFLSGYISVHVNLLSELNQKIVKFLERWDKYEMIKNREKIEILLEEIDKFTNNNMYFVGYELQLLKYILIKFNLQEVFLDSNISLNYFDDSFEGNYKEIETLDVKSLSLEMYGKFKKFITKMEELCHFGILPDDYLEETRENTTKKGKILKFKMKK